MSDLPRAEILEIPKMTKLDRSFVLIYETFLQLTRPTRTVRLIISYIKECHRKDEHMNFCRIITIIRISSSSFLLLMIAK